MFDNLIDEEGINKELDILKSDVCPEAEDPNGCEVGIRTWWPSVARVLWQAGSESYVCNGLTNGTCEIFLRKNRYFLWTL